jgi:hypothetical protein
VERRYRSSREGVGVRFWLPPQETQPRVYDRQSHVSSLLRVRRQVQLFAGDDVNPASAETALSTTADANAPAQIVEARHANFLNARPVCPT